MIDIIMVILSIHLTHNINDSIIINPSVDSKFNDLINMDSIAWENAGIHEYVYGKYDCTEFSKELVNRLNKSKTNKVCNLFAVFY